MNLAGGSENRCRNRRESRDFGALSSSLSLEIPHRLDPSSRIQENNHINISWVRKRVVSNRVVLEDVPLYQKQKRGHIWMFSWTTNRNEGTFARPAKPLAIYRAKTSPKFRQQKKNRSPLPNISTSSFPENAFWEPRKPFPGKCRNIPGNSGFLLPCVR